jgi:dihydropteroate synthase
MDKDTLFYKKHTIKCGTKLLNISTPKVMGILNITPDSFFDGGKYTEAEAIKTRVSTMISEGVDIIDVGAYSSRPGAKHISETEELNRLSNTLEIIRSEFPETIISIDTFRAKVAQKAIEDYKADIINDISSGRLEPEIIDIVANFQVPYITMHMQGTPQNMQKNPIYKHVIKDLLSYFAEHISSLRDKGINDIIIDPGFGFGKTLEHNYQLLSGMDVFQMLEVPILVGLSRKSMIYKLLHSSPNESLPGTIALNMIALQKGASILRVHDIKEAKELITIYEKLINESEKSINLLKQQEI